VGGAACVPQVNEKDLLEFVSKRHLPASYVKEFMAGARKHTEAAAPLDVVGLLRRSWQGQRVEHADDASTTSLRFHEFASFIGTREAALRQSFDRIDTDQDGFISVEDLRRALDDVRVCRYRQASWCKKVLGVSCDDTTRCRVKKSQVNCMLAAMDVRDAKTGKVIRTKRRGNCAGAKPRDVASAPVVRTNLPR
jgi:Ca2+-binding EF-hand superfamily protein